MKNKIDIIKKIFTWTGTLVGTVLMIVGVSGLVNVGLRTYVFKLADQNCYYSRPNPVSKGEVEQQESEELICENQNKAQKQRDAVNGIALLITGLPVAYFFYRRTKDK